MDYRLHKIDSEEKNRILSLHESATKKDYFSTGKKPLFEQSEGDNSTSIATQIYNASKGFGTDESSFLDAVKDIKTKEEFYKVDELLKASNYGTPQQGFAFFVKDEMGVEDADTVESIVRHLRGIGVNAEYKTIGFNNREVIDFKIVDNLKKSNSIWPKEYSCISNHSEAQKVSLSDGSIAYKLNGEVFYNNGRKKDKEGKMVNYSCDQLQKKGQEDQVSAVEPQKGGDQVSAVEPQKERGMNATQRIQQELGVTVDGKVGPETINAMYDKLYK